MRYDPESNILNIEVAGGAIIHAKEFGDFIIHVSKSGKPILIEILNASKFIGQFDKIKNKELKQVLAIN